MHCKCGTPLDVFHGGSGSNGGYLISVATVTVCMTDVWKLCFWATCCETAQQFEFMFMLMKHTLFLAVFFRRFFLKFPLAFFLNLKF